MLEELQLQILPTKYNKKDNKQPTLINSAIHKPN